MPPGQNDSIVELKFTVDNLISGQAVEAEVFANRDVQQTISGEIPLPNATPTTAFMMLGKANLTYSSPTYHGTIHIQRDVAKLRISLSKHANFLPTNFTIDYANVAGAIRQVPDRPAMHGPNEPLAIFSIAYPARTDPA